MRLQIHRLNHIAKKAVTAGWTQPASAGAQFFVYHCIVDSQILGYMRSWEFRACLQNAESI